LGERSSPPGAVFYNQRVDPLNNARDYSHGIPATLHRGRACMSGKSTDFETEPAQALDTGHDANFQGSCLQEWDPARCGVRELLQWATALQGADRPSRADRVLRQQRHRQRQLEHEPSPAASSAPICGGRRLCHGLQSRPEAIAINGMGRGGAAIGFSCHSAPLGYVVSTTYQPPPPCNSLSWRRYSLPTSDRGNSATIRIVLDTTIPHSRNPVTDRQRPTRAIACWPRRAS